MTNTEMYNEAKSYLNGTNGYPKNPTRGWKRMKEAADAGNRNAAAEYAMNQTNPAVIVEYLDKNDAKFDKPNEYAKALYLCALKAKKNPDQLNTYYNKAHALESKLHADGYYYYAELINMAKADDKAYRQALYFAALGASDAMPDSAYSYIGRDRGVVSGKEENSLWLEANNKDKVYGSFGVCKKTEEEAWRVVEANLSSGGGSSVLPIGAASTIIKQRPQGVLEYQRVVRVSLKANTISCRYKYDDPQYSQTALGSFDLPINKSWSNWYADFRHKTKQSELYAEFKNYSWTETIPDARMRVNTPYWDDIVKACVKQTETDVETEAKRIAKDELAKTKNWRRSYIQIDLDDSAQSLNMLKVYMMPYYFFTAELPFKKTATVRVNAQTGEVDYFVDSPFGQFREEDNATVGGGVTYSKEYMKAHKSSGKKSSGKKLSVKTKLIAAVVCFVLSIILSDVLDGVIALFLLLASAILLLNCFWTGVVKVFGIIKDFFKKLFKR